MTITNTKQPPVNQEVSRGPFFGILSFPPFPVISLLLTAQNVTISHRKKNLN